MMNSPVIDMQILSLVSMLINLSIKGSLLFLLFNLAAILLQKSSPARKSLLWSIAFALVLFLPLINFLSLDSQLFQGEFAGVNSQRPLINLIPSADDGKEPLEVFYPLQELDDLNTVPSGEMVSGGSSLGFSLPHWSQIVLSAWGVGALFFLFRFVLNYFQARRIVKAADSVVSEKLLSIISEEQKSAGLGNNIALKKSSQETIPFIWGLFKPVIVVTDDLIDKGDGAFRRAIVHELNHIKRFDFLNVILINLTTVLNWFNPLVWLAGKYARLEMERDCDDQVIRAGSRPTDYARDVLGMAMLFNESVIFRKRGIAMAQKSTLEERVTRIIDRKAVRTRPALLQTALVLLVAAAFSFPIVAANIAAPLEEVTGIQDHETLYENLKYFPSGNYNDIQHHELEKISKSRAYQLSPEIKNMAYLYNATTYLPDVLKDDIVSVTQGTVLKVRIKGKEASIEKSKSISAADMSANRRTRSIETHEMQIVGDRMFRMVNAGHQIMVVRYPDVAETLKKGLASGQLQQMPEKQIGGNKLYHSKDSKGYDLLYLPTVNNELLVAESLNYLREMMDAASGIDSGFIAEEEFKDLLNCAERLGDVWIMEAHISKEKALLKLLRKQGTAAEDLERLETGILRREQFRIRSYELSQDMIFANFSYYLNTEAAKEQFEKSRKAGRLASFRSILPYDVADNLNNKPVIKYELDRNIIVRTTKLDAKVLAELSVIWRDWSEAKEKERAAKPKGN